MAAIKQRSYENNRGLRGLLRSPILYEMFQRSVGKNRLRQRFVNEFVHPRSGDRVLDIGCGPGDLTLHLADVEYHGFDISEAYITSARRRYGDAGRFSSGALCEVVDELEGTCDIVVAVGVLHHVPDSVAICIAAEAHRALKPGGRFLVIEPYLFDGQSRASRAIVSRDRGRFLRSEAAYVGLLKSAFAVVSATPANDFLWIPYSNIVVIGRSQPDKDSPGVGPL